MKQLVVGSRASKLALTQTNLVIQQLQAVHPDLEIQIKEIVTEGDQRLEASLPTIGGKGLFIKEIENALLNHEIDFAVHSLKDMPTEVTLGLKFAAILERANPFDALISQQNRVLNELPSGSVIGTGSPRRACQLLVARSDLTVKDIRGNVDTRLKKLDSGQYDAILLAVAGLERLKMADQITEILDQNLMLPAVGQGALAVQIRDDDFQTDEILECLNHENTTYSTKAERSYLSEMGGGCSAPITAHGSIEGGRLDLTGIVATPDGSKLLRDKICGPKADCVGLGVELAKKLLAMGAEEIIKSIEHET